MQSRLACRQRLGGLLRCTILAVIFPAWHSRWDAQVCDICGRDRGRAEAAHLLRVPQGALLQAALSESGLGCPQSSVQAAAGGRGVVASLDCCMSQGLCGVDTGYRFPGQIALPAACRRKRMALP